MFGRFFATGARNPSRISRLMETTKLPVEQWFLRLALPKILKCGGGCRLYYFLGKAIYIYVCWILNPTPWIGQSATSFDRYTPPRIEAEVVSNRFSISSLAHVSIFETPCKFGEVECRCWATSPFFQHDETLHPLQLYQFFSSMQEGLPLTPLHLAAWNGHATAAQALLDAGASIDFLQEARALWCVEGWGLTGWRTCQHWNSDRWKASSRWKQPLTGWIWNGKCTPLPWTGKSFEVPTCMRIGSIILYVEGNRVLNKIQPSNHKTNQKVEDGFDRI